MSYRRVEIWNNMVGKWVEPIGTPKYYKALLQQVDRVQEELDEVREAIRLKDLNNLLKEGCDLDITVCGLNYLIGGDYQEAITRVLDNNDKKLTSSLSDASTWRFYHARKGKAVKIYTQPKYKVHCVKRTDNDKVMKPPSHPTPDLSDLITEGTV